MDEQIAKLIIGAGATVGVVVWLLALRLYRKMADTPAVEVFETPVPGKTPAEAMKAVLGSSRQLAGDSQLERPGDLEFEITQFRCHSRIVAHRAGGQTMLTAELDDSKLRRTMQRWFALFVVFLMPVTIVGVAAALWNFAAPSAAPGIRTQSVQIVQMVHVLWPPFLFYGLRKTQRTTARNALSNLLILAQS